MWFEDVGYGLWCLVGDGDVVIGCWCCCLILRESEEDEVYGYKEEWKCCVVLWRVEGDEDVKLYFCWFGVWGRWSYVYGKWWRYWLRFVIPQNFPFFFYFYMAYVKIICISGSQFIQLVHAFNIPFIVFCIAQSLGRSSAIADVIGLNGFSRHVLFGNYSSLFLISLVVWIISLFEIHDYQRKWDVCYLIWLLELKEETQSWKFKEYSIHSWKFMVQCLLLEIQV